MQPCIEELAGKDLGKFELLIKVGQAGTIDEITGGGLSPVSPVMPCLGRKLNGISAGETSRVSTTSPAGVLGPA
jgi:hypothetical protein